MTNHTRLAQTLLRYRSWQMGPDEPDVHEYKEKLREAVGAEEGAEDSLRHSFMWHGRMWQLQ